MKPLPKLKVTSQNLIEHNVQMKRGTKIVVDRTLYLDEPDLDCLIHGLKMIEDTLIQAKREGRLG
jgi:hypothetical protein